MSMFKARANEAGNLVGPNEDTEGAKRIAQTYENQDGVPHRLSVAVNRFGEVVLTDIFEGSGYHKVVSVVNLDSRPSARQRRGGLASEKQSEGEWQPAGEEELQAILGRIAYTLEHDVAEAA